MDYSTRQYLIAIKGIAEEEGNEECVRELRESFEAALKAAESRDADALHTLGAHYDYGFGTEENDELAFKYYLWAASLGHAHSMHLVAWSYLNGYGTETDVERAYEWDKKAALAYHAEGNDKAARSCLYGLPLDEDISNLLAMMDENEDEEGEDEEKNYIEEAIELAGHGWAWFNDGNYDEALSCFYQAIGCNDDDSIFYQCRSEIFRAISRETNNIAHEDDADWDLFRAKLIDMKDKAGGVYVPVKAEFLETFGLEQTAPLVYTEDDFDIAQNTEGSLLICIKTREGRIRLPELFYSDGNNAILRRRPDQFILLENIPQDMREVLSKANGVTIAEFGDYEGKNDAMFEGYQVSVRHLDAEEGLDTAEDVRGHGYVFFSALSARLRDMVQNNAPDDVKIKQLFNWEDLPTLAAILAREEDYELLDKFIAEKLPNDPLNKLTHWLFRDWQPTPIYYVNAFRVWANMKEPAKMVAYLAAHGADPNMLCGAGDTPLGNQCMAKGTPEGLKALLDAGADPNQTTVIDGIGFKPLFLVLGSSDYDEDTHIFTPTAPSQIERAKLLIAAGADVNGDVNESYYQGITILSWTVAFCAGDERNELIKLMVDKGANVPAAILGLMRGCMERDSYEFHFTLYEIYSENSPIEGLVDEPQPKMAEYYLNEAVKAGYKPALDVLERRRSFYPPSEPYNSALTEEERKDASAKLYTLLEEIQKPVSFLNFVPEEAVPINQAQLSHSGGLPYFEEGDHWPQTDDGEPLDFVFQVFQNEEGSVALPEGVLLLQYFTAGKGAGLYITYEKLAFDDQITIEPPEGAYTRPYCAIKIEAGLMLPDPEDLYRCSREALTLVNTIAPHRLGEYESLAQKDGAEPLTNDYPDFSCYIGGYPRRESSGRNDWPLDIFLCQLDMDECAQIDFGDATTQVFYDPKRGYTEEIVNEW